MHLFYDTAITEETVHHQMNENESRHICKVLRLKDGDLIGIQNGNGLLATAKITDANQKRCAISIVSKETEVAPSYSIHIAICPTKMNERMEWFVEKTTELGVTEITFLLSKNSERKAIKMERFESIAISAMKQSKRLFLPKINPLVKVDQFVKDHPNGFIAHCYDGEKKSLMTTFDNCSPILIGPEGDFTLDESDLAKINGYQEITLGNNRLRTETAGLYACMQALMRVK
ncbi:MAG: 16S rRNA (uracil(1498)-N(3))-methyltransferase [Crocinitomicaceae bacterium]|nr:16S rRNA (uracil(1498)-N(3))-methyltransferase [Crocinitomicaceae bacterium]